MGKLRLSSETSRKLPRNTNHHAARVAPPSALKQAGTSETRAQRDPVSSLKNMGITNPSRRERRAGGKRRWAFGDRSRATWLSPKGGWSLQNPLAHKEKSPARDLFSGLQCASGGGDESSKISAQSPAVMCWQNCTRTLVSKRLLMAFSRLLPVRTSQNGGADRRMGPRRRSSRRNARNCATY